MGIYTVYCPKCNHPHEWYSGDSDQHCRLCRITMGYMPSAAPQSLTGDSRATTTETKRYGCGCTATGVAPLPNYCGANHNLAYSDLRRYIVEPREMTEGDIYPDPPSIYWFSKVWERAHRFDIRVPFQYMAEVERLKHDVADRRVEAEAANVRADKAESELRLMTGLKDSYERSSIRRLEKVRELEKRLDKAIRALGSMCQSTGLYFDPKAW